MIHAPKITSIQQLERLLAEQRRKITRDVSPFVGDTPAKQKKRIRKARRNPDFFMRTYLPHYFTKKPNWHHLEMDDHCQLNNAEIVQIIGAREIGKTVRPAIGYPIYAALNELRKFFIFLAHTEDLAQERLIAIRAELEVNPRILHDFGKQENLGLWEMDDFTLRNGVRFVAVGYKGHIRGKINGPQRPDYILVDDFENLQTSRNPKISSEKKQYLLEEAYGTLDEKGLLVWLCNLPGKHSSANMFKEETEQGKRDGLYLGKRFVLFYPLELPDGQVFPQNGSKYLWPDERGEDYCKGKKQTIGTVAYQREYMLMVIVEGRIFKEVWFREYKELPKIVRAIMYSDPAFGKTKYSSMKGILLLGWDGSKYVQIDAWLRHESVTSWIDAQYAMWERWHDAINLYNHFVDNNFEQLERLKHDYNNAAMRHKYRIPLMGDKFSENKVAKIEALAGLIENGSFEFNFSNPDAREMREHLIYFPDHLYTEGGDLLASAKRILDTSNVDYVPFAEKARTFLRKTLRG